MKKPVKKTYKEITIPKTIKYYGRTYRVTRIENKAFQGCKKLRTVEIGNHVKKIGDSAFQNCPALTYITIGARVEMIGKNAFRNDKRIREIEIKTNRLRKIGKKALRNTRRGKIIRVPAGKKKAYTKLIKAAK